MKPITLILVLGYLAFVSSSSISNEVDDTIIFESLRKAILKHPGGYVHPSLGMIRPAPSGADRGLGWVQEQPQNEKEDSTSEDSPIEVLRIPLSSNVSKGASRNILSGTNGVMVSRANDLVI